MPKKQNIESVGLANAQRLTTNDQRRSRFPGAVTYNALKTKKMQAVWDWPTTED